MRIDGPRSERLFWMVWVRFHLSGYDLRSTRVNRLVLLRLTATRPAPACMLRNNHSGCYLIRLKNQGK